MKRSKKPRNHSWWYKKTKTDFNMYIRLLESDENGMGECITCKKPSHYKQAHAGHFIHGLHFIRENQHFQCLTHHSKLRMINGRYKSISEIKANDRLWGFDEKTFIKKVCIVKNVSKFLPKELYRVKTEDGKVFYATGDHRVVSNKKWVCIKDMLHNVSAYDIMEL